MELQKTILSGNIDNPSYIVKLDYDWNGRWDIRVPKILISKGKLSGTLWISESHLYGRITAKDDNIAMEMAKHLQSQVTSITAEYCEFWDMLSIIRKIEECPK